jgi:GAF domain-containing protein
VIAIENARLFSELQEANRQLEEGTTSIRRGRGGGVSQAGAPVN